MNHSFDTQVAAEYGVFEAIMIENFKHWITKNKANEKHFYEGRTWTYNSVKAFSQIFHYLTPKQIRTTLDNLREREVIIAGNFNENKYDQTKWYSFVDEDKWICPSGQMGLPKKTNEVAQEGKTFKGTDINPNINQINTQPTAETFPLKDKKGLEKESPAASLTKIVISKFHTLTEKFGLDYHYPKSDTGWGIIHKGIKNVLLKEVCDSKLSIEDNEKRLNEYFNKVYQMAMKKIFPFETSEKIDLTNICSATIVAKVMNYHIETNKIVYEGVVFNITRTDANGVKYDGELAVTAQGGAKFDLSKSMYDYPNTQDANNFSKLKNRIKNGRA